MKYILKNVVYCLCYQTNNFISPISTTINGDRNLGEKSLKKNGIINKREWKITKQNSKKTSTENMQETKNLFLKPLSLCRKCRYFVLKYCS